MSVGSKRRFRIPLPGGAGRVWVLNSVLAASGLALYLGWVRHLPTPEAPLALPWWFVAGLFCLAEIFVVHLQFRRNAYSFGLSEIALILGLFFLPPAQLVVAQLVGASVALSLRRQSPLKFAFNLSHFWVETCLAALIFHAVVDFGNPLGPTAWAGAFLAAVEVLLVGSVMVGMAISLSERKFEMATVLQSLSVGMIITPSNTSAALIAVAVLWRDPWAAWLLLVPVGTLYMAYRAYTAQRQKHESLEFLYQATRALERSRELEEGMVALLDQTARMFRAEIAEIVLFPSAQDEVALRTAVGPGDRTDVVVPVDAAALQPLRTLLAAEGQALLVARPARQPIVSAHLSARGIKDAMLAPLQGETRIIGIMLVGNRLGDVSTFDEEDLRLFQTLVNHTSVSLENGRLEKTLAQLTELEEQRARLLDKVVQAAEDERTRLAGELHDGPIQRLSAIGFTVERLRLRLRQGRSEDWEDLTTAIQEQLGLEIQGLRRLMTELRPPVLDERGLEAALLDYADEFRRRTGIRCTAMAQLDARLDPAHETILYRLAQEALTNVWKHSRAENAWVELSSKGGSVLLEVRDDGCGFDPERVTGENGRDHFGLAVMRERVEMAGGSWEISSRPARGTVVRALLPLGDVPVARPRETVIA